MSTGAFMDVNLQWERNNTSHHTDVFGKEGLIVRRGQPFVITLNRKSAFKLNRAEVTAETGIRPSVTGGTRISLNLDSGTPSSGWSASVSQQGQAVSLTITPSANAPIGKYALTLVEPYENRQTALGTFVLLFNPWCADDSVYMDREEERNEYVMSQHGMIYCGAANRIREIPWNFGQFESGILKVCLKILDRSLQNRKRSQGDYSQRNDPIYVTRVLSAMINSNDDSGVLAGRWSGSYADGVNPSSWSSSVKILRQWYDSNCQPVRYGQCWVFAAVGCTVTRALGIPCRVITNFQSAHDTNGDLKIETYMDQYGSTVKESVWNFHCWLENWMKRPDLKPGYDGWQASDPTPQEQSEGVMCCGPVPVKAIKKGDLTCQYDAAFVYAEVNADVITKYNPGNGRVVNVVDKVKVGQNISTKSLGRDTREDVTHLYKYREGTSMEREAYKDAQVCQDFELIIDAPCEVTKGSDVTLYAAAKNKSAAAKDIRLNLSIRGMLYGGRLNKDCSQNHTVERTLRPGQDLKIPLEHKYSRYASSLCSSSQLQVCAVLTDCSNQATMMEKCIITLADPKISIEAASVAEVGRQNSAKILLVNPLPEPLENCCFTVEGAGLTSGETITRWIPHVDQGKEAKVKIYFTPYQCGQSKLLVNFFCKKLGHVKGFANVNVTK